jgi:glucose-1-phosphate cytidylyltransferase
MSDNLIQVRARKAEPWKVTLVDPGGNTLKFGRLARMRSYLADEQFCFTSTDSWRM